MAEYEKVNHGWPESMSVFPPQQARTEKGCRYHMKTVRCVLLCNKGRWRGPVMVVWRLVAEDRWG